MLLRCGIFAPWMMMGSLAAMTWHQLGFLREERWSPLHRNPIQWPSLLLLGPDGWIVGLSFVICGLLIVSFSAFVFRSGLGRMIQAASIMLGASGLVLAIVAIPPVPQAAVQSVSLHDLIYPLLPLTWVASAVLVSLGLKSRETWRTAHDASVVALLTFLTFLLLTNIPEISQLARCFAFGVQLVWLAIFSLAFAAKVRASEQ